MASILQEKNLFLVWSKKFFFFTWKLEESDLKCGNTMRSSTFNLRGGGQNDSFLEIEVEGNGNVYLYLNNSVSIKGEHFAIIISDDTNSIIYTHIESTHYLEGEIENDLLKDFRSFRSNTKYPITITCISKYLDDLPNEPQIISTDSVLSNSLKELSFDLKKALDQNIHSDVILNAQGINIKAHKMILKARSPVFHKMFDNDSLEASENKVAISDIGAAAMKMFLNYLYTGTLEACGYEENYELFYAADKYEVLSLRNICRTELLNHLQVDNACSLFALAIRHWDKDLKNRVVEFIRTHFKSVIIAESFTELGKDDMALLMRLCVSSMEHDEL